MYYLYSKFMILKDIYLHLTRHTILLCEVQLVNYFIETNSDVQLILRICTSCSENPMTKTLVTSQLQYRILNRENTVGLLVTHVFDNIKF
jgi:hypothetical protein